MADLNTIKGSGRWAVVTPSDTVNFTEVPRGIYVGVTGDVVMTDASGTAFTFKAMAAGVEHSLHPRRINATGTTATSIMLLF